MFAAAALLTLGATSCTKESGDGSAKIIEGKETKMSLSLKMRTPGTRSIGTPVPGTGAESAVNTVNVYVFNAQGDAVAVGAYTTLDVATSFTKTGDTYVLNASNEILTISGSNRVYIGVNLPASMNTRYATEAALLSVIENVNTLYTNDNFVMFSDVEATVLLPIGDPSLPASGVNELSMNVNRLSSKIAVSAPTSALPSVVWTAPGTTHHDLTLTYTVSHFRVYNGAKQSFVAPNYWIGGDNSGLPLTYSPTATGSLYTWNESNAFGQTNVFVGAIPGDLNSLPAAYTGENAVYPPLNRNTTLVMVATTINVDMAADWDSTLEAVVYDDATPYGNGSSDVFVVKVTSGNANGTFYITDELAKAENIFYGLEGAGINSSIFTYEMGYVHFPVYLNGTGVTAGYNNYGIYRNQFLRVGVVSVAGGPGRFPGTPGVSGDPGKAADVLDPDGPNPRNPDELVDPTEEAELTVTIEVSPWDYIVNDDIILQ